MLPIEEALQNAVRIHREVSAAEGEKLSREVVAQAPRYAAAWEHLGNACLEQDRLDEAASCYREVTALHPGHPSGFNNLGNAYRKLRRLNDALASYDQALAIQPDFV